VGALGPPAALGLGIALTWFCLLVLIPLAAVVATAVGGGWANFWTTLTNPQTLAAITLTVTQSLLVTALNVVMGTAIAWVLVRDRFWGKSVANVVIDIPFALPTIVAGLVLLALYGSQSPIGVDVANTEKAVFLALAFVTLPFVVRTVQPVLEELEGDVEEAAASLGAGRLTVFRRVVLPSLVPAIAAGAALSFARGISEYGSLVLLSGNLPLRTEVASVRVLTYIENGNAAAASVVATVLLVIALLVIVLLDLIQRRVARRG
jgi:sulfate transport system permease protein